MEFHFFGPPGGLIEVQEEEGNQVLRWPESQSSSGVIVRSMDERSQTTETIDNVPTVRPRTRHRAAPSSSSPAGEGKHKVRREGLSFPIRVVYY